MIDWNGNGRIDPVDIGVSMAALEDDDKKEKPAGSGCLTSFILILSIVSIVMIVGGLI